MGVAPAKTRYLVLEQYLWKKCAAAQQGFHGDDSKLHLQDELLQWNRLTEEMLYLVIVIVGTVRLAPLRDWSCRERRAMTDLCCASRRALHTRYQQRD